MAGIKAGELFVQLGIKGGEKAVESLQNIGKGLKGITSTSLETKAAILAAMYGIERLMSSSGKLGTDLINTAQLIGTTGEQLQRYAYAAQQAGISSDEVIGSFKNMANVVAEIDLSKGLPAGLQLIGSALGGIDRNKIHDIPYMIEQMQKFAQRTDMSPAIRQWALQSMGMSQGVISAMMQGKFTAGNLASAPVMNQRQLDALKEANVAWMNLGTHIETAFGRFNARHGKQMVKDLSKIMDKVILLLEAIDRLATKLHVFGAIETVIGGAASVVGGITNFLNNPIQVEEPWMQKQGFKLNQPKVSPPGIGNTTTVNHNQVLQFSHPGVDPNKTVTSVRKANKEHQEYFRNGSAAVLQSN